MNAPQYWIFQGNPDSFQIDRYLLERIASSRLMQWTVNQHRTEVRRGDQVFLWRARGSDLGATSGLVAIATCVSDPMEMPDDAPELWIGTPGSQPAPATQLLPRVDLAIHEIRLTPDAGMLTKDMVSKRLADLRILKMRSETNYRLTRDEAEALVEMWGGPIRVVPIS